VYWITPGARAQVNAQIKKRIKGRGGTSFDEAYARVEKEGKFNALVHLTDGEVGQWPAKPRTVRKLVVALLGSACKTEVPSDARVIEVEL
jgi:predicted metal-dependent peptidase